VRTTIWVDKEDAFCEIPMKAVFLLTDTTKILQSEMNDKVCELSVSVWTASSSSTWIEKH